MRLTSFLTVLALILLSVPSVYAASKTDTGAFGEGFQTILTGLQNENVAVGLFVFLLGIVLYGAIASSLKASPLFGGQGELDKLGKVVSLGLTGIFILSSFFFRKNAIKFIYDLANRMSFIFALLFSILVYISVRWMFKSQNQGEVLGSKIESLASWVSAWACMLLFATAWGSTSLMSFSWLFLTIGTFVLMLFNYNSSTANRPYADIGGAAFDTANAGTQAARAVAAGHNAANAAQQASASAAQVTNSLDDIGQAVRSPITDADRKPLMDQVREEIEDMNKTKKDEKQALKLLEDAIASIKKIKQDLVDQDKKLKDLEVQKMPQDLKKKVTDIRGETQELISGLDIGIPDAEKSKNDFSSQIDSNQKSINEKEQALMGKVNELSTAQGERIGVLKQEISGIVIQKKKLVEANNALMVHIEKTSEQVVNFAKVIQSHIPKIAQLEQQVKQKLEEERKRRAGGMDPDKLYEGAIKAKGRFSGHCLTTLAELDKKDFFYGEKENLYQKALDVLKTKKVKFKTSSSTSSFGFIFGSHKKYTLNGSIFIYTNPSQPLDKSHCFQLTQQNELEFTD
jgi:hypothetical protein